MGHKQCPHGFSISHTHNFQEVGERKVVPATVLFGLLKINLLGWHCGRPMILQHVAQDRRCECGETYTLNVEDRSLCQCCGYHVDLESDRPNWIVAFGGMMTGF